MAGTRRFAPPSSLSMLAAACQRLTQDRLHVRAVSSRGDASRLSEFGNDECLLVACKPLARHRLMRLVEKATVIARLDHKLIMHFCIN